MSHKPLFAVLAAFALILAPMGSDLAAQQGGVVTGQVVDAATGQPVAGAQVSVEGTRSGMMTQENGRFMLTNVPEGTWRVSVQHIAFARAHQDNVQVRPGETATVNFQLRTQVLSVEAIVATGVVDPTSGIKIPFTVARVTAEDMPVPTNTSAAGALAGKVAGAQILRASGTPGSGVFIQLRTPTSIYGSNSPMFVVDGVVLSQSFSGTTADIEALDIETIEVVKGAAAASMYGSRAANGVVSITTRRGSDIQSGRTRITVRTEAGQNIMGNTIPQARNHHFRVNEQGYYTNVSGEVVSPASRQMNDLRMMDTPYDPYPTYDHVAQFFHPGQFMGNSLSVGQNMENTNWQLSYNNYRDRGVFPDTRGFERNNVRLNLDHRFRDDFNVRVMMYHNRTFREELHSSPFDVLLQFRPDVNLALPNADGTPWRIRPDPTGGPRNPLYDQYSRDWTQAQQRTQGSIGANYRPLRWLSFDGNLGYDRSDRGFDRYLPKGTVLDEAGEDSETGEIEFSQTDGYLRYSSAYTDSFTGTFTATVLNNFGPVTTRTYYRGVMERDYNQSFTVNTSDFRVGGVRRLDIASEQTATSSITERNAEGHMVATAIDWQEKYIADVLFRRDGSSLFGPEARWNNYWRGAINWRMSQEPWFNVPGINEFQLRYSHGTAGGRPNFAWQYETFTVDATGITKGTLGNKFLAPELTTEKDFTIRTIFANNRYSLDLTRVVTRTEDQLLPVTLPAPFGFNTQRRNAGTIEGNVWEATLEAMWVSTPQVSWRSNFVLDRSRHKVVEFDRPCYQEGPTFYCPGLVIGTFYTDRFVTSPDHLLARHELETIQREFDVNDQGLLVWVGEGNTWRDGLAKELWGTSTSIDGFTYQWGRRVVETDEFNVPTRIVGGDSNVDFNFGLANTVRYGSFSVYAMLRGQIGGNIYNSTRQLQNGRWRHGDVDQTGKPLEERKTLDYYSDLYNGFRYTDFWAEDGTYAKISEVRASWRVPQNILTRMGPLNMQRAELSLQGRNLYSFTNYSGYDPEVGSNLQREDNRGYPLYRTITADVRVTF